jgi:outer membrane lipoprotein-sorting protein
MKIKKIILGIFITAFLSGCAQNAALLGPIYTLSTTGNIYQAGASYGSNRAITSLTGKSTTENIKELIVIKKDDSEFEKLVKRQIKNTRKKLNLSK